MTPPEQKTVDSYHGREYHPVREERRASRRVGTVPPRKKKPMCGICGIIWNDKDRPADEAGVQRNDVIVEFAGVPVRGPRDLQDEVEQRPVESQHPLKVIRGGQPMSLTVTLKPLPKERPLRKRERK